MLVHRNMFTVVPFDQMVPRGEDIDFLMNAKMFGFTFYPDNKLSIKHLPPTKTHFTWKQLREDIYRFVYERAKIRDQRNVEGMTRVLPEDFDPYPGCFLKYDHIGISLAVGRRPRERTCCGVKARTCRQFDGRICQAVAVIIISCASCVNQWFPCIDGYETIIVTAVGNNEPEEDSISYLANFISCAGVGSIEKDGTMRNWIKDCSKLLNIEVHCNNVGD